MYEEKEIIQRIQKGEYNLFSEVVKKHSEKIFAIIWRIIRNETIAEEIMSDTFLKTFNAISKGKFKRKSSLYTFIYRIAVNTAMDYLRQNKKEGEYIPYTKTPEENLKNLNLKEAINRAISALPPQRRTVFVLRYYEDLSYADIAKSLFLSEAAVRSHYHLAIKTLRKFLKEFL